MAARRRRLMLGAGAALLARTADAAAPIRLLVLDDLARAGQGAVQSVRWAAEEFGGGRLGAPVEVLSADPAGSGERAEQLTLRGIDEDGASAVILVPPPAALAQPVARAALSRRVPALLAGTEDPMLAAAGCAGFAFRWLADERARLSALTRGLQAEGITRIRLEGLMPAGPILEALAQAGIKFDAQAPQAYRALAPFAPPPPDAVGSLVLLPYTWSADGAARTWVRRFVLRFGRAPDPAEIAAYEAARHFLAAMNSVGRPDLAAVARQMRYAPITGAFTRTAPIAPDGRAWRPWHLMRVRANAEPWDAFQPIRAIPPGEMPRAEECR